MNGGSLFLVTGNVFLAQRLRKSPRSLRPKVAQTAVGIAVIGLTGALGLNFAIRGQAFQSFDDRVDPLAQSKFGQKFNPHLNETLRDIYVARLPLPQISPDLIEDYQLGGSMMVERYCAGLLGGLGAFPISFCFAVCL